MVVFDKNHGMMCVYEYGKWNMQIGRLRSRSNIVLYRVVLMNYEWILLKGRMKGKWEE